MMDGDMLGAAIKSDLDAMPDADRKDTLKVYQQLATSIIQHIQNHAIVNSGISVSIGQAKTDGTGTIS